MRTLPLLLALVACDRNATLTIGDPVDEDPPVDTTPPEDSPDVVPDETDTPDVPDEPPPPEVSPFDGALLQVLKPISASIDNDGNGTLAVEGWVVDAEGDRLDFTELRWWIAETGDDLFEGNAGEAPLRNGVWTVIVEADLPNGDHLAAAIGGVRVQGPRAGIYAGLVDLTATVGGLGVPLTSTCLGSLILEVGFDGDVISGEGDCGLDFLTISLSLDLAYEVEGDVTDPDADGALLIDAGLIDLPVDWEGGFNRDGDLNATLSPFGFELFGYTLDFQGTLEAQRVSLYVDP